jgi:hypothetical protein
VQSSSQKKTHKSTTTAIDTNCKLTQSECINIDDDDADDADADADAQ